ncbi:MAG: hypothetical protein AAGG48_10400 [Planctomycetota bacterium]
MNSLSSLVGYIGPGLGAGAIAVILAVLISVLFAVLAIVWYPLKRAFKRIAKGSSDHAPDDSRPTAESENTPP